MARDAVRPSAADLAEVYGGSVPDLVGPDIRVLLIGINPSLYSAWAGLHFARPGNRLWRTLYEAGFTPRQLDPAETAELLAAGIGITNLVTRATARADELSVEEIRAGVEPLCHLVRRCRPPYIAFLGISAYRVAFSRRQASIGEQPNRFEDAQVWVLPNPSGLNASYQQAALTRAYAELQVAVMQRRNPTSQNLCP